MDSGPPYIVKLANLPVTANDEFVEDLFKSRYTSFVKFKIVFDPLSQPLESGVVKKIAFVELLSFSDQSRVLKWHDLYYRGLRRVAIESADFHDFQNCMSFNQENELKLRDVEREFLSGRNRHGWAEDHGRGHEHQNGSSFGRGVLGNHGNLSRHENMGGAANILHRPALQTQPKAVSQHPKSNPFGNAKPVDVLSKLNEMDKHLITIGHTTITAPGIGEELKGAVGESAKNTKSSFSASKDTPSGPSPAPAKPGLTPAPIPSSVYGQRQSLADILSKNDSDGSVSAKQAVRKSATGTPKPQVIKPTILKKKPAITSPHQPETELAAPPSLDGETDGVKKLNSDLNETLKESEAEAEVNDVTKTSESHKSPGHNGHSQRRELKTQEVKGDQEKGAKETRGTKKPRGPKLPRDGAILENKPKAEVSENRPAEKEREERGSRFFKNFKSRRDSFENRPPKFPAERRGSKSDELHKNPEEASLEQPENGRPLRQQNLLERNKAFAASSRPDFKKHLSEITHASEREHKSPRKPRKPRAERGERTEKNEPEKKNKLDALVKLEKPERPSEKDAVTELKAESEISADGKREPSPKERKSKRGKKFPKKGEKTEGKGESKRDAPGETKEGLKDNKPKELRSLRKDTKPGEGPDVRTTLLPSTNADSATNGENLLPQLSNGEITTNNDATSSRGRGPRGGFRGRGGRGGRGRGGRGRGGHRELLSAPKADKATGRSPLD